MVLVRNSVHAASLSPAMQKKVVQLCDKEQLPFWPIVLKARKLKQDIFLCGFGAPFEFLGPENPARGPGGGSPLSS